MEMEIVFLVEIEEQIANCSLRSRGKIKELTLLLIYFAWFFQLQGA